MTEHCRTVAAQKATQWAVAAASLWVGLSVVLPASQAMAAAVPFNEALTFAANPNSANGGDFQDVINSAPVTPAQTSYSKSGSWGSSTAFASADLATGQLKASASDIYTGAQYGPYIQSNAIFGDSFTANTAGGTPFSWTPNSQAAFHLALNGSITSSAPLSQVGGDLFVILSILQPGTLDPHKPLINGPTAEQYFFWNIGNPTQSIYYTDQQGQSQKLTPTATYNTIPSNLTASFNPDGNFDWVLLLGIAGQDGLANSSWNIDLSHTLTLSYAAPDGSVTTAASGVFHNFDATLPPSSIPEPSTLGLLAASLAAFAATRRRRGTKPSGMIAA